MGDMSRFFIYYYTLQFKVLLLFITMKNYQIALWSFLVILFDLLFWQEKLGLNVLVFSTLLMIVLSVLYADNLKNLPLRYLLAVRSQQV